MSKCSETPAPTSSCLKVEVLEPPLLTASSVLVDGAAGDGGGAECNLLLLLSLATLVEVLDDDADEHVEHEEADEQQERDEVEKAPFVVVDLRLQRTS